MTSLSRHAVSLCVSLALPAIAVFGCSSRPDATLPPSIPASSEVAPAIAQSSIVSVGTPVPKHMPTMAFDEYSARGAKGTAAQAQTYLTYAEGGFANTKAVDDCHGSNKCYSVFYFMASYVFPNGSCTTQYASGLLKSATESWFVHQRGYSDAAHRLTGTRQLVCNGVAAHQPVYALNNFNSAVRAYDQSYLRKYADAFDYYEMDRTSATVLTQMYGPGGGMCRQNPYPYLCTTTQEYPYDPSIVKSHDTLYSSLTHTNGSPMNVFFNGITFVGTTASDLSIINGSTTVRGAMCEDCVVSSGKFRPEMYASVLNAMFQMSQIPNASFIQLNVGSAQPGSPENFEERKITAAMTWLGYYPGHTIVFPDLESNTTNLAIWPEYNIVPTNPVETMTSSFADLQVAPRIYRREFRNCYNYGAAIGQCAAIINGNSTGTVTVPASWLKQTYGHLVRMYGGDIPSGGKVLLTFNTFVPGSTTIAAGHAILISR